MIHRNVTTGWSFMSALGVTLAIFCGQACPAMGWGSSLGPCLTPPSATGASACSWYPWDDGGVSSPRFSYDRHGESTASTIDFCRLAADPRHSTGKAEAVRLNAENEGLSIGNRRRKSVAQRPSRPTTDVPAYQPPSIVAGDGLEYPYPMSRCDQYWCPPWQASGQYEDPIEGRRAAEFSLPPASLPGVREVGPVSSDTVDTSSERASGGRAVLRPLALAASSLLDGLGQQMIAISRDVERWAEVRPDVVVPDPLDAVDDAPPEYLPPAAWPELHLGI